MGGIQSIALLTKPFLYWGGGIDFLRNFANALLIKEGCETIRLSLLFPEPTTRGKLVDFLYPYKRVFDDLIRFRRPHYYRSKPIAKEALMDSLIRKEGNLCAVGYPDEQRELLSCLGEVKADVVLPLAESPGASFTCPWVGYIPDLQHKNLPHLFRREECTIRDRIFSDLLNDAKAVIVNSQAVKSDLEKFYPGCRSRIIPLPFAPVPLPGWFDEDPCTYRRKYDLPERYFMISNQFWAHKSHMTAFEALHSVRKITPFSDIHIVCTGETGDYRFPKYFETLTKRIGELNLSDSIRFLGFIPKMDQLQIMRNAIALLQPTLCEGGPGGGAVYDAVALGIPSITSDISVNKEIEGEHVYFFRAGSSEDMTEKMADLLKKTFEKPSKEKLMERGYQRASRLRNAILEAIDFVVSHSPRHFWRDA